MAIEVELLKVRINGVAPLLQHNGQLADPMNPFVKEMKVLTAKKNKKTESDLENLAKLELLGGVYWDRTIDPNTGQERGVYLPDDALEANILDGAKKRRAGNDIRTGVIVTDARVPLTYAGMGKVKKLEDLAENDRFRFAKTAKVAQSRIVRTRPIFNDWSAEYTVQFDPTILNRAALIGYIQIAGKQVGLCDWRPKYGRYEVEVLS